MSIIFISYRRGDSAGYTGRLTDRLMKELGDELVFRDFDDILPGQDFPKAIQTNLYNASVLLVVIGKEWLTALDDSGRRRLENPNDFVRLEIETALERNIQMIPVLVKGARMPEPNDLPESISALAHRQAIELTDSRWEEDVNRLIQSIEPFLRANNQFITSAAKKGKINKVLSHKLYLVLILLLLITGIAWMNWPADFSGRWYYESGNYLWVDQNANQVKIQLISPGMQKVYANGEGIVRGRWLEFSLDFIYTDRYSYRGRLEKSWNGQELQGELIETLSGEQSTLKLTINNPALEKKSDSP